MYINKIIELLQKYINDYEAKKYELEVLKTKKQLYEELIPLLENKTELNDNKLFISVLLSSIYNNEEYNKFLNTIKQRSIHNFNTNLDTNDKILTLSTCYSDTERTVVHAKLIKRSPK